jgi:4-hydroxy-tetrahydrodipicolinate reductase
MTVAIAIAGATGRMGRALIAAAAQEPRVQVVGASERPGSHSICLALDAAVPHGPASVSVVDSAEAATSTAAVWIDFTTPQASLAALEALAGREAPIAAILGTTGFDAAQQARVAQLAQRMAIVQSGNFSLGVNLLAGLVRQAAARLGPAWDIEIIERHHRHKVDAPSGTALLLGQAAAQGRGVSLEAARLAAREGATGARPEGAIGFAAVRGGAVVGDHEVQLIGELESLTLSHHAHDRSIFAAGALAAAVWVAGQPPGLYSMADVLGL